MVGHIVQSSLKMEAAVFRAERTKQKTVTFVHQPPVCVVAVTLPSIYMAALVGSPCAVPSSMFKLHRQEGKQLLTYAHVQASQVQYMSSHLAVCHKHTGVPTMSLCYSVWQARDLPYTIHHSCLCPHTCSPPPWPCPGRLACQYNPGPMHPPCTLPR
jgi:hypothetical protein